MSILTNRPRWSGGRGSRTLVQSLPGWSTMRCDSCRSTLKRTSTGDDAAVPARSGMCTAVDVEGAKNVACPPDHRYLLPSASRCHIEKPADAFSRSAYCSARASRNGNETRTASATAAITRIDPATDPGRRRQRSGRQPECDPERVRRPHQRAGDGRPCR